MSILGWTDERLANSLAARIEAARFFAQPFGHIEFNDLFPPEVYDLIVASMPGAADYRPMNGRSRQLTSDSGVHTRVKVDLFPELVRHFAVEKRELWQTVGRALRSDVVREAFKIRLVADLRERFGETFSDVGLFPIPILTRDIPGYFIAPHTDTRWKGITVQIYLPADDANTDIGTIFHEKRCDGSLVKQKQIKFAPNSGYAFVVGQQSWHSADPVHQGVVSRDSILLTYFVDKGVVRILRNRGKRLGNLLLNEGRKWLPYRKDKAA